MCSAIGLIFSAIAAINCASVSMERPPERAAYGERIGIVQMFYETGVGGVRTDRAEWTVVAVQAKSYLRIEALPWTTIPKPETTSMAYVSTPPSLRPWPQAMLNHLLFENTRESCERKISLYTKAYAHLKEQLQLLDSQRSQWLELETILLTGAENVRDICADLAFNRSPALPDAIDIAQEQIQSLQEMLRAARAPIENFYDKLSDEQCDKLLPLQILLYGDR